MVTLLKKKALALKPRPTPKDLGTPAAGPDVAEVLVKLDEYRKQRDHAEEMVKALQHDLLEIMKTKTATHRLPNGVILKATRVDGRTTTRLNDLKLKKRLGAQLWMKVTSRALDQGKLESSIANGTVDPVAVAACIEESVGEPYIIFSRK